MDKWKIIERNEMEWNSGNRCWRGPQFVSFKTKWKYFSLQTVLLFEGCKPSPICLFLLRLASIWSWVRSPGEVILTGYYGNTERRTWASATSSTINLTRTVVGTNSGVRGERPATNRLSHQSERYFKSESAPRRKH